MDRAARFRRVHLFRSARVFGDAQAPARQPAVTTDVYGHKDDGLALCSTCTVRPAPTVLASSPSRAASGNRAWSLPRFSQASPALNEGFTVFVVRHGSRPRYPLSSVVADMRRSVRFIHQHAKEHVDPNRIGVFGNSSGGHLALLLGMTGDSGNPSASDPVLRESSRVAAVVANYPGTDLARLAMQHLFLNITAAEAAEFSPIRFVSPRSASLIAHGEPTSVPIDHGETIRGVDEGGRASVIHSNQGRGTRVRGRRCRASLCCTDTVVRAASRGATGRGRGGCRARRRRRARTAEELRAQQRQARIAELRQRFVDGPVFVMACGGSGTSNSLGAVVIPDAGTVSIPIACRDAARSRRRMACWWRPMAARGVCRRPHAATMRRSPETGGRSRRRRDGLFAKEHGETTKLSGSSRDVHDYLRALACSRHHRFAVPANRRLNNLREMSRR